MPNESLGREELVAWKSSLPINYYDDDHHLRHVLDAWATPARRSALDGTLSRFGHVVATEIEPAVVTLEQHREFPRHVPYDAVGQRIERIDFHPARDVVSSRVWDSGLVHATDPFEQAALFYLLSHVGEGGVACPVVCTVGLGRAVARRGSAVLQDRYLQGLRSATYDGALRGSQFLTEVQGGSDVGANEVVADDDENHPGAYRLRGEKWFCSVIDADLFAITARPRHAPAGTRGLGLFLVPRTLDGVSPNGFRIRQLKDKLGTRALASAEIDLDGAVGWPIGDVTEGFKVAVQDLLNTSRWLNAVGSTGLMRRAYLEAMGFVQHRTAFGTPLAARPIIREQLATMKMHSYAALSSTFALTSLQSAIDAGVAGDREVAVHRFLVNANKYVTSAAATDVVHRGIELLGGNGTIESFSPLPRLYRDAVVYESWEGTHNVLCAQIQRDFQRLGLLEEVVAWIRTLLVAGPHHLAEPVSEALDAVVTGVRWTLVEPDERLGYFRRYVDDLMRLVQAATMIHELAHDGTDAAAVAQLFVATYVLRDLDALCPPLANAALGDDLS